MEGHYNKIHAMVHNLERELVNREYHLTDRFADQELSAAKHQELLQKEVEELRQREKVEEERMSAEKAENEKRLRQVESDYDTKKTNIASAIAQRNEKLKQHSEENKLPGELTEINEQEIEKTPILQEKGNIVKPVDLEGINQQVV